MCTAGSVEAKDQVDRSTTERIELLLQKDQNVSTRDQEDRKDVAKDQSVATKDREDRSVAAKDQED